MNKPATQPSSENSHLTEENNTEERFQQELSLGDQSMDSTHWEFVTLVERAAKAAPEEFASAMHELVQHTRAHFSQEESRMQSVKHRLLNEHQAEHQRILGDMERFSKRAEKGRSTMARAWVSDNLMDWFATHARTMDSALAADLVPRTVDDRDN